MNSLSLRPAAVAIAMCAALGARAAGSEPWPEVPLPPKSQVEWVGDSLRVNGVPMRVMRFASRAGRAEIVEYYRACWSGAYPTRPSVRPLGQATVVGQAHGPYYMTVKVKDAANQASEGTITVSRVLGSKVDRSAGDLPLLPGAKVVSVVEANDPGRHSREVVVANPASRQSVVQYYQASLQSAGWSQIQANDTPPSAPGRAGSFLAFQRGRDEVQLSIVDGGRGQGSLMVANRVTKDTGPVAF
jgi:hypothetical protein